MEMVMDDLKERLHQIACCEGECMENRIEAWERIAKQKAKLDEHDAAWQEGIRYEQYMHSMEKMVSKCKHQWYALASECWLCGKPIEEHIEELESKLDAYKGFAERVCRGDIGNTIMFEKMLKALNGKGHE